MIRYSGSSVITKLSQLIKAKFDSLATVAKTGSYNDLSDKPQIGTTSRASVSIASDSTSTISIPLTIIDVNQLTVYQNGLILTPDVHYTATTSAITLVNHVANTGDIFTFIGTTEAGVSLNASASQVLFSDTTSDGCYGDSATVQDALIHAAEFRSDIKSISVNGEELVPSNGNLDIEVPSVPIKSVSLYGANIGADAAGNVNISGVVKTIKINGTSVSIGSDGSVDISGIIKTISVNGANITTDSNGKVAITGLVKSLSLNGTSYTPNTAGVLTLTDIMKTNVDQTMSAKLVAQNNTNYTTKQVRNVFLVPKSSSNNLPTGSSGDICIIYKDS